MVLSNSDTCIVSSALEVGILFSIVLYIYITHKAVPLK